MFNFEKMYFESKEVNENSDSVVKEDNKLLKIAREKGINKTPIEELDKPLNFKKGNK